MHVICIMYYLCGKTQHISMWISWADVHNLCLLFLLARNHCVAAYNSANHKERWAVPNEMDVSQHLIILVRDLYYEQ